jgi:hypothetical protein
VNIIALESDVIEITRMRSCWLPAERGGTDKLTSSLEMRKTVNVAMDFKRKNQNDC